MTLTVGDVASLIIALATAGSLLYISQQVRVSRQQTKGQFLLALDEQIEKNLPIAGRLLNEPDFHPVGNDWPAVWRLMTVFERINIMVEDKILDVAIVDRLYGFLLISIVTQDDVFNRVESSGVEWQDFIDLCYRIADHRQRNAPTQMDTVFITRVHKLSKETHRLKNPFSF